MKAAAVLDNQQKPPFVIPEGYMTDEEFKRKVKADLKALYIKHGLPLQKYSVPRLQK